MITLSSLIDIFRTYQFRAPNQMELFLPLAAFFSVMLVVAIVLRLVVLSRLSTRYTKDYLTAIINDLGMFALLGGVLLFARLAGIAIIGARVFLLLLLFLVVWKVLYFAFYRFAYFPIHVSAHFAEQKKQRYLPKRKKKK